jgi:hypothetical protein
MTAIGIGERSEPVWRTISLRRVVGLLGQIAVVKLSLKSIGFDRTRRLLNRWSTPISTMSLERERAFVSAATKHVTVAAAFFPGRALCLEQSLVLYHLLTRNGIPARFRLGVRTHRFEAHAWVEWRGEPVNEPAEIVRRLAPLPDLQ